MVAPQLAALIEDSRLPGATTRLGRMLDFLSIPWQAFRDTSHLAESVASGSLEGVTYSVIGSLPTIADLFLEGASAGGSDQTICGTAHSAFAYLAEDVIRCEEALRALTNCADARLLPLKDQDVELCVTDCCPDFTGPMHGLRVVAKARPVDRTLSIYQTSSISKIIVMGDGVSFFSLQWQGLQTFVSCSSDIPDLNEPLKGRWYDVKEHFLSVVPLLLYLKWAFRDVCWQANDLGACLIVDDPVLKTKYGFCNFRQLEAQMQEYSFSTNISVIPWNWRRTSGDMAALMRNSGGRLSISVHGCDHTGSEFGTHLLPALNGKVGLAKERMERHRKRSGLSHDLIMVFPQGAFSRESLAVLQQHQFLAVVNTEVWPTNSNDERLTLEDMWSLALLRYSSFPLFTRRYPAHGLENFAFDLLLGKPCLIVEHHEFFKNNGQQVVGFVKALNSLNSILHWRSLGDVIRRSYQWRRGPNGVVSVKMFANEMLLHNEDGEERFYQIQKADRGSAGVEDVTVGGRHLDWQTNNGSVVFNCTLPAGVETLIRVQYCPSPEPIKLERPLEDRVKTAFRRSLSEFRDTCLSRYPRLMPIAQKAKKLVGSR